MPRRVILSRRGCTTVTLDNGEKNLGVGILFTNLDDAENFNDVLCLCLHRVNNDTAETLAAKIRDVCLFMTGMSYEDLCHSTMADFAALAVAVVLRHLKEGCSMHHSIEKAARSAVGDLTRSRGGRVQNAFPEAQRLLALAHDCAKYFSYGGRLEDLHKFCDTFNAPAIKPQTDISTTRIAARRNMAYVVQHVSAADVACLGRCCCCGWWWWCCASC
jgi:hypothetical protein